MVTMNGDESSALLPPPAAAPHLEHGLPPPVPHMDHPLDDDDDAMSDGSDNYDDGKDLMTATMEDEVTAQLAAAGPVGMAAAAAIASAKKRKRPHQFETNPSIRKRQQTRLLRKLRQTIDEFTIRVGMQAVVLVAIPGKPQNSFKCFGAKPLEDVVRNMRSTIISDLETALAQHTPAPAPEDPSLHELPPLVIDGIPTPVEKMTQAQLRAFIPLMLKYSTGRGKPGWGKESTRPPWWPQDLPWANVRMDARTEDEKQQVSWTHALRQIVINCYKYHQREDLLPVFSGDPEEPLDIKPQFGMVGAQFPSTVLQTITNPDGTMSVIQVDPSIITLADGTTAQVQGVATLHNSDGGVPTVQHVQTIAEVAPNHHEGSNEVPMVDLNSVAQALSQEGQIILTGEDGQAYPVTVSGMITVPVPHNMYQTVVAAQIQTQQGADGTLQKCPVVGSCRSLRGSPKVERNRKDSSDSDDWLTICVDSQYISDYDDAEMEYDDDDDDNGDSVITPMVLPKIEPGTENEPQQITTIPMSALTGDPTQNQLVAVNANGQVVHNDKIYQICEYTKPDSNEKVIMMAEVSNAPQNSHPVENGISHHQSNVQTQDIQVIQQNDGATQNTRIILAKENSTKS